jgi:glycosyltransferase involved in cell wall biosynthesis
MISQLTEINYSLLVPCYNAQTYIDAFIANLLKLQRPFDEVIFYDDASTDATLQTIKKHGFAVIEGKLNKGPGYARNRLAQQAKGKYIHFHDVDDEFNPAFLNLVDDQLKLTPANVVLGNADWVASLNRATLIKWRYDEEQIKRDALTYFITNPLGIINTVYQKESFLKVSGFNEAIKCWEDADLHVRLAASGASFALINETIAYSIRHEEGISKDQLWCWGCRLSFLASYLELYSGRVSKSIFEGELLKVQNVFVYTALYKKLGGIIRLIKQYKLSLSTWKISTLYNLNKLLPASVLKGLLNTLAKR